MERFKKIENQILLRYERPEEYLTNHYPKNYFDFFIDVGARGIKNPWHINHMALANPETLFLGYEPDLPYYNELVESTKDLKNVKMHREGFGTGKQMNTPQGPNQTVSLTDIFTKNTLDCNSTWAIKFDCEGGEYALMEDECRGCVELMKKADHISLEFHIQGAQYKGWERPNFFIATNRSLPRSFVGPEEWMMQNFSESHDIFLTSYDQRLALKTFVLLSNKIMSSVDSLFWKDLL